MKSKSRNAFNYYLNHVRAYPRHIAGILIGIPLTNLANTFLPPLIVADVLAKLTHQHYTQELLWSAFGGELVLYAALLLSGIITWRFVDFITWRLEASVQRTIAEQVFKHLLSQSADFHANNFTGSLVSQTSKLLGGYVRTADTTIFQVYPLIVSLILTNIILLPKALVFVVALDIFAACFIGVAFKISKPVQKASAKFAGQESIQTGLLADAVTNVMTIKSYARNKYEEERFRKATSQTQKHLFAFARVHRRQMNRLGFLSRMISSASLTIGVLAVVVFKADIGTMFLIVNYTAQIVSQLFDFSNGSLRNYARALGDASDMVEILAQPPEVTDPAQPEPGPITTGSISFNDVTFQHKGSDDPIFNKLSLHISPGEKIGLVGHSGSGKTTLTRLLLRFSDIDGGSIVIGGKNIALVAQDTLHQAIAYVPQEPLLFHRSIGENIAYGKPHAAQAEVEQAARSAHAEEFIVTLPKGYDTLVGERGVKLSGGQRQRVAIARATLKDAPILLLDEATSALDSESEVLIQEALWRLMEGRTAIVIAHRLSTIQKMDRIIVLDNGAIVEEGSHKELLKRGGKYAKLWAHQSGGFIEE